MTDLTYRAPVCQPACHASFAIAGSRYDRAMIQIRDGRVVIDLEVGRTDDDRFMSSEPAAEVERLLAAAANDDAARARLAGMVTGAIVEVTSLREARQRRRWEMREEYDTRDEQTLRATLRFRSVTAGRFGGAHFDLPTPHTYVIVCTAGDGVAVLLDEGYGHEDFVVDQSASLVPVVDGWKRKAAAGDRVAIETLRSFPVEGIKKLRARRAAEGMS